MAKMCAELVNIIRKTGCLQVPPLQLARGAADSLVAGQALAILFSHVLLVQKQDDIIETYNRV